MKRQPVYLDYAAATPVDSEVAEAMQPYLTQKFYNPSANYQSALDVRRDLDQARKSIAFWLGSRSSEITFTAGGTEANNLAIQGIMDQFPDADLLISAVEHESVLVPAGDYRHKVVNVLRDGRLDLEDLRAKLNDKTVLVSVMYANNEIGTVQPIKQVATELDKVRRERLKKGNKLPLYLHTDACQAANYLDLHVARLGVDLMTLNGGKIYGPKQTGVLYIKAGVQLRAQILGGGQERGLRSGTENVAGGIGFSLALDKAQKLRHSEVKRLTVLRTQFINLIQVSLPQAQINGSLKTRLPNNVHITIPGQDNERLLILLDEAGVMAAAGSACSASNEQPSHVLTAIELSDEQARSSLRFTLGRATTSDELALVVKLLANSVLMDRL